jgi:hypothetical protein
MSLRDNVYHVLKSAVQKSFLSLHAALYPGNLLAGVTPHHKALFSHIFELRSSKHTAILISHI